MKLFRSLCASVLLFVPTVPALAQVSSSLAPERQVHLDLTIAGAAVGFAARTSERTMFGVEIGGGGNWVNYTLAGSHFSKGGARNSSLVELAHATVFMRTRFSESQHLDLGAKVSAFLHFDSSDDEPGGGYFVGLNAKYSWAKWRRMNLASEMDIGRFAEPGNGTCLSGCEGRQEFGINVAPILVRFTFP
ncbi:MAG: hypothetical protein V4550_10575 [Gemmatimonadota bacterium]